MFCTDIQITHGETSLHLMPCTHTTGWEDADCSDVSGALDDGEL